MNAAALQSFLDRHQLTRHDLAWLTGKNIRTVHFWFSGTHKIPQMVFMLCRAIDYGLIDFDWLVATVEAANSQK